MKIIDTVICCGDYESELIYTKVLLESPKVDEFIFIENAYDYRGNYKGYFLNRLFEQKRFDPFREKLTVFMEAKQFQASNPNSIDPPEFATAEAFLREVPTGNIIDNYDENDRILLTDCDEMFDFIDEERTRRVLGELGTDDPIQFERIRYWLDWDMMSFRSKGDIVSPSFKVKHLKNGVARLSNKKWVGRLVENGTRPFCFEYCNCFPIEGHYRKYSSSLHTYWTKEKIDEACLTGTWAKTAYQGPPDRNCRWDWLLRVKLHENNSPQYIIDNLDKLKTNLVPDNYIENRLKLYGFDGMFPENKDFDE